MDSKATILSNVVFGPGRRLPEGGFRSTASGIVEPLVIYTWPAGVTDSDKLKVLSVITAYGTSESESPSKWATFTFSYCCLCFPEFAAKIAQINSREYTFERFPMSFVIDVTTFANASESFDEDDNDTVAALASARRGIVSPGRFPEIANADIPEELAAGQTVEVVYGYCSLLIFLSGKKINERNSVTITEKRPQNLIDAYAITEDAAFPLSGDGKMSSQAHKMVNQAWVTYASARQAIISEVAVFSVGASLAQRVVYTISKMLENSGMGPAYFIHKFLLAMPHAAQYSCIAPSLAAFKTSIREVAAAPAHLQPYYKLIHGDGTRAFHRNTVMILAACAITYERFTSSSMSNFDLGEGTTTAINMFDAEAKRLGHQTLADLTTQIAEDDIE